MLVGVVAILVAIGLASDEDGGADQSARTETMPGRTRTQPKKKPAPPKRVRLRVVPATPTWVCVDRGVGTPVIFENTIDSAQTFHGKQLRINLGKRDVELRKNGKPVQVTAIAFGAHQAQPRRSRVARRLRKACQ